MEFWTQIAFCMGEEEKNHEKAAKRLRQTHASGLLGGFLVQTAYAYQCRDCGKVAYSHSERDGFADSSFVLGLTLLPQAKQTLQDKVDEYQAPRPLLEYVCPTNSTQTNNGLTNDVMNNVPSRGGHGRDHQNSQRLLESQGHRLHGE